MKPLKLDSLLITDMHTAQLIIKVIRTGELICKQIVVTSTILIKKFMKNTPGVLLYISHISM